MADIWRHRDVLGRAERPRSARLACALIRPGGRVRSAIEEHMMDGQPTEGWVPQQPVPGGPQQPDGAPPQQAAYPPYVAPTVYGAPTPYGAGAPHDGGETYTVGATYGGYAACWGGAPTGCCGPPGTGCWGTQPSVG